eukprot:CAMPEP_0172156294 /NCGR_PEP_ID=MMETSP1050-20130122/3116_1 /TAXON_ID=233186 /ORGANISM="Cryptomonas curvata, Strain CCAP979/52" /LENGTH=166 /DNA_ID=CAMNT_0012825317 /DNA_START=160 /DNA_END=657 /DNA_ORIENTATION=+
MLKNIDRVLDIFEHWKMGQCPDNRLILYLSTDSPAEYSERLGGDVILRQVPDLGDRLNRLHRFHNIQDHEAMIISRGTKLLFSVDIGEDLDPTGDYVLTHSNWFCSTTQRPTPLIAFHPPHNAACWDHWSASDPPHPPCAKLNGAVGGLASAFLDMAAAIRAAVDF